MNEIITQNKKPDTAVMKGRKVNFFDFGDRIGVQHGAKLQFVLPFRFGKFDTWMIIFYWKSGLPKRFTDFHLIPLPNMAHHEKFEKEDFYLSPEGYIIFTEKYHLKRGYCCQSGCRHCPWKYNESLKKKYKRDWTWYHQPHFTRSWICQKQRHRQEQLFPAKAGFRKLHYVCCTTTWIRM